MSLGRSRKAETARDPRLAQRSASLREVARCQSAHERHAPPDALRQHPTLSAPRSRHSQRRHPRTCLPRPKARLESRAPALARDDDRAVLLRVLRAALRRGVRVHVDRRPRLLSQLAQHGAPTPDELTTQREGRYRDALRKLLPRASLALDRQHGGLAVLARGRAAADWSRPDDALLCFEAAVASRRQLRSRGAAARAVAAILTHAGARMLLTRQLALRQRLQQARAVRACHARPVDACASGREV
eukprot:4506727-Pleurochrysis_carterae.AAC.1